MPIEFDQEEPRPLPVLILADTSSSMTVDGKMDVLNDSIVRTIAAFEQLELPGVVVHLGVISFGGSDADVHLPLTPLDRVTWGPLASTGRGTPMGSAFRKATAILDDPEQVSSRSYQPNLILVSDGMPTDKWQAPLGELNEAERAGRALRFAVGIGADRTMYVLESFAGEQGEVVPVEQVAGLPEFFRYVTYTVSRSVANASMSQADLPRFEDVPSEVFDF